jgi:cardiolipin synthase
MNIALSLTCLRLILSPLLLAPLIAMQAPVSITFTCYIFLAATDFFDGFFARLFKQTSSFGAFLDQFSDKVFLFSVMFATVYTHQLPVQWALLLCVRELWVMGLREWGMQQNITLPVIPIAKFKTAAQMILFAWLLVASPNFLYSAFLTTFLCSLTVCLSYSSAYLYTKKIFF